RVCEPNQWILKVNQSHHSPYHRILPYLPHYFSAELFSSPATRFSLDLKCLNDVSTMSETPAAMTNILPQLLLNASTPQPS
ncbi:hypothetical protein AVEN_144519-1, partial [Araneus ventricosus]